MKIAILTNFDAFNDNYSLTHVVRNQAVALVRHGHDVTVFVRGDGPTEWNTETPYPVIVIPFVPVYEKVAYCTKRDLSEDHKRFVDKLSAMLIEKLTTFDLVITHDWILTSHCLPLAEALHGASRNLRHVPFLHWIHSIPIIPFDWWEIDRYGHNHRIVYANKTDQDQVAVLFGGEIDQTRYIPHIVDLRTHFDFDPRTWAIIDKVPGLISSTFVQVYPAAAERLRDKGVSQLIHTFKAIKQKGFSIACLVVDSWTGVSTREDTNRYQGTAFRNDINEREFAFMSRVGAPHFTNNTPRKVLRELSMLSSLFVYPTQGECFGLCAPEACLAGGALPVFNRDLPMMVELSGANGLHCGFGSHDKKMNMNKGGDPYGLIARMIVARAKQDTSWQVRTHYRQNLNMDTVYRKHYEPVLAESRLWVK